MHYFIGGLGHFLVILSFVTSIVATLGFFKATVAKTPDDSSSWLRFARRTFILHSVAVLGIIVSLFIIIHNHYFEYHYAWAHSSRALPVEYMISCFWEGQEGSFLLWLFWNIVLGAVVMRTNVKWQAPVMTIFGAVQAFLASMILGVVFFNELKLGSSPFILLRDAMPDAPEIIANPEFIPEDGTGLNPILQNYWMVIHPPVVFLGYATSLVPFSFVIAGLWLKKYKEWVRPALPWTIFGSAVLGLGIIMGGYWAYETLSFGGYWSWDPVENAVYIPWLVMVGSMHTMITYRKSGTALRASIVLVITVFILVLYSTFLVRSGILGDSSVHSFTDLGLSGQLLLYLFAFLLLSAGLAIARWRQLPAMKEEVNTYSREFWIFIGVTVLGLMALQVLIPTSIPVYKSFVNWIGFTSNAAQPEDPISFYSMWQMWLSVAVAILSGTGQFFWWKKMDRSKLVQAITIPIVIALFASSAIIIIGGMQEIGYMVLLTAAVYSIVANSTILIKLFRTSPKLSGGSIAHIGLALMLLGILFSEGYSKVVSKNIKGTFISRLEDDEFNQSNVVLRINQPRDVGGRLIQYKGRRLDVKGVPGYIAADKLLPLPIAGKALVLEDLKIDGKTYHRRNDTVEIHPENVYFEVDFIKEEGKQFTLFPRIQLNPQMGLVRSPDIKRGFARDLYTHVLYAPYLDVDEEGPEWSEPVSETVKFGGRFFIQDRVAMVDSIVGLRQVPGILLQEGDAAVQAHIRILDKDATYTARPIFFIKDKRVASQPSFVDELGVLLDISNILPDQKEIVLSYRTTERDFVILKALEKPQINILWIGTILLMVGFSFAIVRRYQEFRKMRDKGVE